MSIKPTGRDNKCDSIWRVNIQHRGGGRMPRRKWNDGVKLMGRPRTAKAYTWTKHAYLNDEWHPKAYFPGGALCDVTPAPGRTYTRQTWPPRGRGRGESLLSDRRLDAKLRARQVIELRLEGHTFEEIGAKVGLSPSGAYRAMKRTMDRIDWDQRRARQLRLDALGVTEADLRYIQYLDEMGYD